MQAKVALFGGYKAILFQIKTYPRKIESTLRQTSTKGVTRAEKRKARAERKAAEKAAKMADVERLKRLKMAEFAEKLERIRKTCGDGIAVDASLAVNMEEPGDVPVNEVCYFSVMQKAISLNFLAGF